MLHRLNRFNEQITALFVLLSARAPPCAILLFIYLFVASFLPPTTPMRPQPTVIRLPMQMSLRSQGRIDGKKQLQSREKLRSRNAVARLVPSSFTRPRSLKYCRFYRCCCRCGGGLARGGIRPIYPLER